MTHDFPPEFVESAQKELAEIERQEKTVANIVAGEELDNLICAKLGIATGPFSSDWNAAMVAVQAVIDAKGYGFRMHDLCLSTRNRWNVEFFDGDPMIVDGVGYVSNSQHWRAAALTGPLAICRAITLIP